MKLWRRILAVLVLGIVVGACGGADDRSDDEADEGIRIVVTTTLLGDLVERLVGDSAPVRVDTIIPVGASPHEFQASARQADDLRRAAAVIANGAGLESGLVDILDAVAADGVPVHEAIDVVQTRTFADDGSADGAGDGHGDAGVDPHFFTDPVLMADAVEGIAEFLLAEIPELDASAVRAGAATLRTSLEALDREIVEVLAPIPGERRLLVTNHDAFGYFADRYGFDVVGTVIPGGSTAEAATAGGLAELAALVRDLDIAAVFSETASSDDLVRALAEEVGRPVAVVALYTESLGTADIEASTYEDVLRTNARRIAAALTAGTGS